MKDINNISVKAARYQGLNRVVLIENNEYGLPVSMLNILLQTIGGLFNPPGITPDYEQQSDELNFLDEDDESDIQ